MNLSADSAILLLLVDLRQRIAALEADNAQLREQVDASDDRGDA